VILQRLRLSRAKHPSLTGHPRMARRVAAQLPHYEYDAARFFRADGAPDAVAARREAGFERLAALHRERFPETTRRTREAALRVSDQRFTSAYRVPFQFRGRVREALPPGGFAASTEGVTFTDLDGNRFHDLSGSYGVNVFGHDFYRACVTEAEAAARALGPMLGSYHESVARNAERICEVAGQDEVSFHMSGTEAVMQAVRLARYHTRRTHLVRFCGAYHGWWGDVQPGIGNPTHPPGTHTLAEMSERTLGVLRRRRDVACVLVNPMQALNPNGPVPSDGALVDGSRRAAFDREGYGAWLRALREVCDARGIVLILDEVFSGFRLARGGAQEWFGVHADLVTYGKTLGGGLPVGVLAGRADLMMRYREDRPADVCFARGTFNSHPYVMAAMDAFLGRLDGPEIAAIYDGLDARWEGRAAAFNAAMEGLPVRVEAMSSVWTVLYDRPSRYNWMLQFYLRAEGIALGWTGTGRLIFSLDHTDADMAEVTRRFAAAARAMDADGWWWTPSGATDRTVRRGVLREALAHRLRRGGRAMPPEPRPAEA
jgi:glutamate-1-semialdehyde 2,1-aminomutase